MGALMSATTHVTANATANATATVENGAFRHFVQDGAFRTVVQREAAVVQQGAVQVNGTVQPRAAIIERGAFNFRAIAQEGAVSVRVAEGFTTMFSVIMMGIVATAAINQSGYRDIVPSLALSTAGAMPSAGFANLAQTTLVGIILFAVVYHAKVIAAKINMLSFMMYWTAPTGTIVMYAGVIPPRGWQWCDGREYPRMGNNGSTTSLYEMIGTQYGEGAPDPVDGFMINPSAKRESGGSETVGICHPNLPLVDLYGKAAAPGHFSSHTLRVCHYAGAGVCPHHPVGFNSSPAGAFTDLQPDQANQSNPFPHSHPVTVSTGGENRPLNIVPRFLDVGFIIRE